MRSPSIKPPVAAALFCLCLVAAAEPAKTFVTATGAKMALIPGGEFVMGSDNGKEDERPARRVKVDSFALDVYEVPQESYEKLMGMNPSKFINPKAPVERLRWTNAALYCNARSQKEGLKPCYDPKTWACDFAADGYRLPTEAEWEYACAGGTKGDHYFSGGEPQLGQHAWFRGNSQEKTHPAGTRKPNPFGLYDMYGNVSEWCNDWYAPDYYQSGPPDNPKGPVAGKKRVLRGGAWADRAKNCRTTKRFNDAPTTADICQGYDTYGFRCARNAPADMKP